MAQQNIDFGTFPDDPSADAIRTAFQKTQNNFSQLFSTYNTGAVSSVNQTPGAGITVNFPTGNVVISANIACLQISTSSLKVGRGSDNTQSTVTITSSSQVLNIDVDPAHVYSNYFANVGNTSGYFYGKFIAASNDQPNISNIGTLVNLASNGTVNFTNASNVSLGIVGNVKISGGSPGQLLSTDGAGNLNFTTISSGSFISNGTSNVNLPISGGNITFSSAGNANIMLVTGTGVNVAGTLSVSGNANLANLGTNLLTSTGNITGGNISTGGLLTVTGNANIGNIGTAGLLTVTGNITGGNISTGGLLTVTGNANIGNIGTGGLITATGNVTGGNITTAGQLVSSIATGTAPLIVTSTTEVANLKAANATIAGTVTAAAQGNITSVGILSSVSVSGNANIGNIGTSGLITVTGNANIGNIGTATVTATGNITGANIITSSYHIRSVSTSITAAGTTQGTATALTKEINVVSTVSAGANGVVLPTAVAGMVLTITNSSATALNVYPASGGQINALGTNIGLSQPGAATLQFVAPTATQWYSVGATYA